MTFKTRWAFAYVEHPKSILALNGKLLPHCSKPLRLLTFGEYSEWKKRFNTLRGRIHTVLNAVDHLGKEKEAK